MVMVFRLYSFRYLHDFARRIDPKDQRTTQTVCLLSVFLLLPYLIAKSQVNILLASVILAYLCMVWSMITTANYKLPNCVLRPLHRRCIDNLSTVLVSCRQWIGRIASNFERGETVFLKLTTMSSMINQMIVFMLSERIFLSGQKLTSLYSLMFYNLITYSVVYISEIIRKFNYSLNFQTILSAQHVTNSTTKVLLEWTREVTFVITVLSILFVLGLRQGLHQYHPTWTYLCITGLYYIMTEKTWVLQFPAFLTIFRLDMLESFESVWAHIILKTTTAIIATILSSIGLLQGQWRLSLYGLYTCVWLRWKDMNSNELSALRQHQSALSPYRFATDEELIRHNDVCAICLSPMKVARITPCNHIFHGDCLRLCLDASTNCPLCKRQIKFSSQS